MRVLYPPLRVVSTDPPCVSTRRLVSLGVARAGPFERPEPSTYVPRLAVGENFHGALPASIADGAGVFGDTAVRAMAATQTSAAPPTTHFT